MPISALIPINYFIHKSHFGLNRALVFAGADRALLMLPNGGLWETFVAFITQNFNYLASLKTINQRTIQLLTPLMASINYRFIRHEWRLVECYASL